MPGDYVRKRERSKTRVTREARKDRGGEERRMECNRRRNVRKARGEPMHDERIYLSVKTVNGSILTGTFAQQFCRGMA